MTKKTEKVCPTCGRKISPSLIGRRPLAIGVINVCDAVYAHSTVVAAAQTLGCSRAYVYKVLGEHDLTAAGVRNGKRKKKRVQREGKTLKEVLGH